MELKDTLKPKDRMDKALGQTVMRIEAQLAAQPCRLYALAALIGIDGIDIVYGTREGSGSLRYYHTGEQPLIAHRQSVGLRNLIAAITASATEAGFKSMQPVEHLPLQFQYMEAPTAVKFVYSDRPQAGVSPRGVHVYSAWIRRPSAPHYPEPAYLKIGQA